MTKRKNDRLICIGLVLVFILSFFYNSPVWAKNKSKKDYGVFLNLDVSDLEKISEYSTVVIDAQYFSRKDISYLKKHGCIVYSYLNIGSIENFREYYDNYEKYTLGDYENWDDEKWIDVSQKKWQKFLVSMEKKLLKKGIDGFFVDNCDVYYQYQNDSIFNGLTYILKNLMKYDKAVIINGGDTYVMEYKKRGRKLSEIMTGVNQECVWSSIDFKNRKLVAQKKSDRKYFQKYIETCDKQGMDVYLLEYTTNKSLISKIKKYCKKKHFHYYCYGDVPFATMLGSKP